MSKLSDMKTWLRATVRDNKRLRGQVRALLETQDELVTEVNRLDASRVELNKALDNRAIAELDLLSRIRTQAGTIAQMQGSVGQPDDWSHLLKTQALELNRLREELRKAQ